MSLSYRTVGLPMKYFSSSEAIEGQGLVEYALIVLLVTIAAVAALTSLGTTVVTSLQGILAGL